MKLYISMTIHRFLICSLVYFAITYFFFALTTGGWYGVFFIYLGMYLWTILLLIVAIALFIRRIVTKINSISINIAWLKLIVSLQIFATFLNQSDCGDNPGSYSFLQVLVAHVLGIGNLCARETPASIITLWMFFFLCYITLLILGLAMIVIQTRIMTGIRKT